MRINARAQDLLVVNVNVSPQQLAKSDFPAQLARIIKQSGVRPETIRLEITESELLDTDATVAMLQSLVDHLGLRCVIDDFGAGYSNLKRLIDLPVCGIKIDQSIVALDTPKSRQLVAAITTMARAMEIDVTAEGVERVQTLDALRAMRCRSYQGFLFSEALPEDEFVRRYAHGWDRALVPRAARA